MPGSAYKYCQSIVKDPELVKGVERVIWYNESVKPLKGFNYECDRESAETVFKSGVRIDVISNLGKSDALFDSDIYTVCGQSKTKLATVLFNVHSQIAVLKKLQQNHFGLSDDLVALYLTNPELFSINTMTDRLNVRYDKDYDLPGVKEAMGDMINGIYAPARNVVFNRFPCSERTVQI